MATPGRGSAYALALLLLAFSSVDRAHSAVLTVGGASGWNLGVNYTTWAAGETFKVGDVLFFPYTAPEHDVVVVNKAGYDACSDANAITTYSKGNDNITLSSAGSFYYLCSVPGHCSGGMKLAVDVHAASGPATPPTATAPSPAQTVTSPAPSSSASTPTAAPAPSSPASTPTPAPASSSPASTPTPTPAPAPAAPVPAPGTAAPGSSLAPSAPSSTPATTTVSPPSLQSPPSAAPLLLASATGLTLLALLASMLALGCSP